jgi:alanine racemase
MAGFCSTTIEVDLNALAHNLSEIRKKVGAHCKIMAIVKANAYGHGAVKAAAALARAGADWLGVASTEEGIELRRAGLSLPILVMGGTLKPEFEAFVAHRLTPVVYHSEMAPLLEETAARSGKPMKIHVKVDTGMGRLGLFPEDAASFIQEISRRGRLTVEGLMTHFAEADLEDQTSVQEQIQKFRRVLKDLDDRGIKIPLSHLANSAAIFNHSTSHFQMVRPGIALYGYAPGVGISHRPEIEPCLRLTTRIVQVKRVPKGTGISYGRTFVVKRESLIASLPIGYADGYSRRLSNKGQVLIRQQRVPIVGRVCMDMMMADVSEVPDVRSGDEVVLLGQQGNQAIWADEIARWTGTIPYEVLSILNARIARRYIGQVPEKDGADGPVTSNERVATSNDRPREGNQPS